MFIKVKALNLLRKLDWDITINSLLSFVKIKGYSIKICEDERYLRLVSHAADNNLLYPNSFILEIDGSKVLVLRETYSNLDILVQIAHIILKHKVKNDIRGNTGRENREALLFAGLVLRPNNSLIKTYRNIWICIVIISILITANICSFVKLEATRIKYAPKILNANPYVYITKNGGRYHRDFCEYVQKDSGKISRKEATAAGYEPCKVCNPEK